MSADNFDKKPDNSINQDEELTAILQRLSSLLDKAKFRQRHTQRY